MEIPHQRRVKSLGQGSESGRGPVGDENQLAPDITTAPSGAYLSSAGNKPFAEGDLSVEGNEWSLPHESGPVPTVTRTAARELQSHLVGSRNGEELG